FGQALEAVSDPVLIQQGMPHMQALSIQLLCLLVVTLVVESSGEIPELVADAILIPQILKYGQALLEERDRTGVFALLALDLTQVAQGPAYTVEIALLPVYRQHLLKECGRPLVITQVHRHHTLVIE